MANKGPFSTDLSPDYPMGYRVTESDVFFDNKVLVGADPASFVPISYHYGKDSKQGYFEASIIPEADPGSLEYIGQFVYAKDRSRVYFQGLWINEADPQSFQPRNPSLGVDTNAGFYHTLKVPGSDPASTQLSAVNTSDFIRVVIDKSAMYCFGLSQPYEGSLVYKGSTAVDTSKLAYAFPSSIDYEKRYFTDGLVIIHDSCKIIAGANLQNFLPLERVNYPNYYGDGKTVVFYVDHSMTDVNPLTFQPLGADFAKDDTRIFFAGKVIDGVDYPSFKVLCRFSAENKPAMLNSPPDTCGGLVGQDKNRIYYPDQLLADTLRGVR